jgi:hypothetical protein
MSSSFWTNLGDRVGSTAVQAFAGSLGSVALLGFGDWKSAVVTAAGASLFAVVKVLGVTAASVKSPVQAEVAQAVPVLEVDADNLVKAIGNKLLPSVK